jgi:hypothetical protein
MNLSGFPTVSGGSVQSDSTTPMAALGSLHADSRGRMYRYVMAGAQPLVVGNVVQAPPQIAVHGSLTPTIAQAVGSKQIIVTLGAAAAAENYYAEGLATIDTTPGEGYSYSISGHAAVLSAGVATINLRSDDAIQVALTTASRVSLTPHYCRGVIQSPAVPTGVAVGVAVYPIGAGKYGWVGVEGDFPVLIEGAPVVGQLLSVPGTVPGAATVNSTTLGIIGRALVTGVAGKIQPALINLL